MARRSIAPHLNGVGVDPLGLEKAPVAITGDSVPRERSMPRRLRTHLDHKQQRRLAMKMLTAFLTATVLAVGVTGAFARDQQATGAELDNQLNWRAAHDAGAYASARAPAVVERNTIPQSSIDFQEQGSY
jgi:hypothetical protein